MLSIRSAVPNDVAVLKTMIHEFAEFEHDHTRIAEDDLVRYGFASPPKFRAVIAEWDAQPAGYALFFDYYSSFRGPAIFLEDIYVRPQFRGKSIGKALFARVAAIAREGDSFGVMFNVLDWNRPAIEFYQRLGATFLDEWKVVCLERTALENLAKEAPNASGSA
jgi:GNAT superfamily N-acetyltransferase